MKQILSQDSDQKVIFYKFEMESGKDDVKEDIKTRPSRASTMDSISFFQLNHSYIKNDRNSSQGSGQFSHKNSQNSNQISQIMNNQNFDFMKINEIQDEEDNNNNANLFKTQQKKYQSLPNNPILYSNHKNDICSEHKKNISQQQLLYNFDEDEFEIIPKEKFYNPLKKIKSFKQNLLSVINNEKRQLKGKGNAQYRTFNQTIAEIEQFKSEYLKKK